MTHVNLIRQVLAATALASAVAVVAQAAPAPQAPSGPKPAATAPAGPLVAYNEAVRIVNGKRVVQLPPQVNRNGTKMFVPRLHGAYKPHTGFMVETEAGLMQCAVPFFDKDGCEPSSYGSKRMLRTWIVLRGGEWQGCIGIDQPKKCRAVYPKPGSPDMRLGGVMPAEGS